MSLKSSTLSFVLSLVAIGSLKASNLPTGTELVLVPLAFKPGVQVSGARGTIWQGEVWVENRSEYDLYVGGLPCLFLPCTPSVPARSIGPLTYLPEPDPGVVLRIPSSMSPFMTFSNRLSEITRRAQPQGIQLPVVHDRDFIVGETSLLGIPTAGVRTAVRIYDPLPSGGTNPMSFRVEAVSDERTIVGSATLSPRVRAIIDPAAILQPAFDAIYDVAAVIPAVNALARYHLRIIPLGSRAQDVYWVMGSVTDNETQQVLLITPQ